MNPQMQDLFNTLRDGMIIVSPEGMVRYANRAARRDIPFAEGALVSDDIRNQLRAASQGYVQLPVTMEVDTPDGGNEADRLRVTIVASPVGDDYVLVVHNVTEVRFYETAVSNLAEMMNHELKEPFQGFLQLLERLQKGIGDGSVYADPAMLRSIGELTAERGSDLMHRINQLMLLAEVYSHAPVVARERIASGDLLSDALHMARPILAARRIRVSIVRPSDEPTTIYGSRSWLTQALAEYIQHVAANALADSEFILTVKGNGGFVMFRLSNTGQTIPPRQRERTFMPFHRGNNPRKGDGLGLGLALCKRVVELHQGHVRLMESADDVQELVIELPIGGPQPVAVEGGSVEQTLRYAQDLARLMQRLSPATA